MNFSTMATFEERLNPIRNKMRACKTCRRMAIFHCDICEDTDSCIMCHKMIINEFKMHSLWFELCDEEDDLKHINPVEARSLAIQRCITSLEHVSHCRDENCSQPSCLKLKRLVSHAKTCKRRGKGCTVCENVVALLCFHRKHCSNRGCTVPFCSEVNFETRRLRRPFLRSRERMIWQAIRNSNPTNQASADRSFASPQPGSDMKLSDVDPLQAVQQQLSNLDLNMFMSPLFSRPNIARSTQAMRE